MASKFDEWKRVEEEAKSKKKAAQEELKVQFNDYKSKLENLKKQYQDQFGEEIEPSTEGKAKGKGSGVKAKAPEPLSDKEIENYLDGRKQGITDTETLKTHLNKGRKIGTIKKLGEAYIKATTKDVKGMKDALIIVDLENKEIKNKQKK